MSVEAWAALGSAVTAVVAVVVAVVALRRAGESNRIAERANEISGAANEIAGKNHVTVEDANRIAVDAREEAEKANAIAERALSASLDTIGNTWAVENDDDGRPAFVRNDCAHVAYDVRVVVDRDGDVIADVHCEDELAGFDRVPLACAKAFDKGKQYVVVDPRYVRSGTLYRFTITYRTKAGHQRSDVVSERLAEPYDGTFTVI